MRTLANVRNNNLKSSDFTIILIVTALTIFGVVMVFSASYYYSINSEGSPYVYLRKQGVNAVIGFVFMFIFAQIDYHKLAGIAKLVLIGSILLLLLLFTSLGMEVNGATRWLDIGIPVRIMPGEIAKIGAIIFTAAFLAGDPKRIYSFTRGILPMAVVMGILGGLIILQPNLSTAITVCGIIAGMMFIAGLSWKWVTTAFCLLGGGIFAAIFVIGGYWKERFTSFLDPFKDALDSGFQVVQSLLALGTGGLFGLGLGKSVQKNLYLPEPQNDFILAIIGEELGFVGILVLFIVYGVLIWRCFHICMNAPDRFGMLLSGGITIMLGLQLILNVAVVTSSMPPTGIALPFISYGGNSLWIFTVSMGIMLNISRKS